MSETPETSLRKPLAWIRTSYRGFLWPYLTFLLGMSYGLAAEAHGWPHDLEWPAFAGAMICMNVATSRIQQARRD